MLLVHHDEPQVVQRREHGGSRADDDVDVAAADPLPLIVALAVGQAAVLDRDAVAERFPHERGDGRRQRDFRHEHQRGAAGGANLGGEAQVNLRLAASRHSVQQGDPESPRLRHRAEASKRGLLLRSQLAWGQIGV